MLQIIFSGIKLFSQGSVFFEFTSGDVPLGQLTSLWIIIMIIVVIVCFFVSEITRNYSQVDKLWSLMPLVYSFVTLSAFPSPRIWIMSAMVALWGLRLSYNFYRKGGYNLIPWRGEEDYRWKIMRQNPVLKGRFRFGFFNLFFISFYQHFLILLFSSPLLLAAKNRDSDLTLLDIIAATLMMIFLVIETIADNQQFRFQSLKHEPAASGGRFAESLKNGFISEGLWSFVRHPNFVSEQAIWISFYFFGIAASGKWINWTLAGPVLLVLLFLGSSQLTESLSSGKYPAYSAYKKEVPCFLPRLINKSNEYSDLKSKGK
jgi:steroid 5-alpha reductase family enzyme